MANKGIRGITIELGGNTVGLQKALQDVNNKSKDLQSELRQVDRLLKFDPGNSELIAQKQQLLAEQVQNTTQKLNQLKQAQSQVEEQFKNGDIGAEQYRAFQREIAATEGSLNGLKEKLSQIGDGSSVNTVKQDLSQVSKEAGTAGEAVKGLGGELAGLAAGLVAGGGIAGAIGSALDTSSLNTKIEISMEVPEESKASVKEAINTVSSYGVDAESALEGVRRQWALNADATEESVASVVNGAATITAAYAGIDFTELIQETNEISSALKISDEQALGLVDTLLKTGFPPEQLDIIAEYGTQLQRAGYTAEEVQAIMAAGVSVDSWNIDVLLDGIKEGRIVVSEFGQEVPKSMKELIEGTDISAKQLQEWGKAVAAGGEGGSQAMQEIAKALNNVDDATQKNAIGVGIFGTLYEENGQNIIDTLLRAEGATVDLKAGQDALNASTAQLNADPAVQMQQAFGELKMALEPLLTVIAEIISKIATWVSENPQLAATITAIVTAIGILMGIMMALAPIFTAISSAAAALGVGIGAILGPIGLVVAAIAGLIAAGIAIYQNWDEISVKAGELAQVIGEKFEEFRASIEEKMAEAEAKIKEIWGKVEEFFGNIDIKETGKEIIQTMINGFTEMISPVLTKVTELWDKSEDFLDGIDIAAIAKTIFTTFINGIGEKISDTKNKVTDLWNAAEEFLDGITILSIGKDIFSTFIDGIAAKISDTKSKVKDLWDAAEGVLDDIDLSSIGKDAIKGLINGLGSMKDSIIKKVRELASLIPDGLKDFLGIHSPSRLIRDEVGKWVPLGLAEGIEESISAVTAATDKMAEATIPTIPTIPSFDFASPNVAAGRPIYVTFEMDGETLGSKLVDPIAEEIVLRVGG